ncbi:hypothetical protein UFOVP245_188 [uncultured Caudovirales phage]|uniref:Uncharacterized protein n=1 Tax=uncultured Caudovirales phage TaxID=2100421 RepID=A0A6J7WXV6_9CAUD|nr:hypothetical protein UFOVP245_188 [uncultured Caudovirales phage]
MIIISHRGLVDGDDPTKENNPTAIAAALGEFFLVYIDLWMVEGKPFLGTDGPVYPMPEDFIHNPDVILCPRDRMAVNFVAIRDAHFVIPTTGDYTLTSYKWLWAKSSAASIGRDCIIHLPEDYYEPTQLVDTRFTGVCTKYPRIYHEALNM